MQPYLLQPLLSFMKKYWSILPILLFVCAGSCGQPVQQVVTTDPSTAIAFPGAEGFGKYTSVADGEAKC
jgi:ABC-type microcin C transport system permease subunit YejB